MKQHIMQVLTVAVLLFGWMLSAGAHCEIPCGIYDDKMRITLLREHLSTIEKSMRQITALETEAPGNANQLVRWVMNKEAHADDIQHITAQYFLTQRIKPGAPDYIEKLSLLHQMLVTAMRCKQTVDVAHVAALRNLVSQFEALYFKKK